MLTPRDVGHRVVIRRLVTGDAAVPRHSDVLGELVEVTGAEVTVLTARGEVRMPQREIEAAKRVPDRRRLSATERLERIAAAGWPAPEREDLGDWLLRAGQGWTNRANSALPTGLPGCPLPVAVDHVQRWYAERGLRPAISVPEPVGRRLTDELRRRGWVPSPATLVRTASLESVIAATGQPAATGRPPVGGVTAGGVTAGGQPRLDPLPPEGWLAVPAAAERGLPPVAYRILTGVPAVRFAGVYAPDGSALAIARGVVAEDHEWLGLSLLEVDPAARRQGLATTIVNALARWAAEVGAHRMYLQVLEDNTAANRLYERLGVGVHHRYVSWRAPA